MLRGFVRGLRAPALGAVGVLGSEKVGNAIAPAMPGNLPVLGQQGATSVALLLLGHAMSRQGGVLGSIGQGVKLNGLIHLVAGVVPGPSRLDTSLGIY